MNVRKIIIAVLIILLSVPLSIVLSSMLHIFLSNKIMDFTMLNSEYIFNYLIVNNQYLKLYAVVQSAFVVITILLILQNKDVYASRLDKVTDTIKTPVAVGQYQHGSSRWLTEKERRRYFAVNKLDDRKYSEKTNFSKGGLIVGYRRNGLGKEEMYYVEENTHSLTVGGTRSGKTRTIVLETICNLAMANESMVISDPKGEIFNYTNDFLKERGYEIIVIDFKNPQKSSSYNFLQPVINAVNDGDYRKAEEYAWDITASLVGNEDTKMEKIWRDGEMSIIAGTIMSVVYDNKEHPEFQNLTNVYSFISEMCKSDNDTMPINEYIMELSDSNPAKRIFNIATIAPEKTRSSFFTSALATLKLFTSQSIYSMTCKSDFELKEIGMSKKAIYVILPDERLTYYSLASLFVNQLYTSLVELADSKGGELPVRVNHILDEFGNFTTIPGFANMLTVGGGRKIRFNIFLQSFAQLEQKYGKEGAENILDNCQTWIYLKTANIETAAKICKKLGTYTTSSYSKSNTSGKQQNGSESQSFNLIQRPLLTEDEILRIERPYVLVIKAGIFPMITKIPDLSKWYFNKLLGLGDVEHNRRIREERENAREVKQYRKLQLWGIWNEYK